MKKYFFFDIDGTLTQPLTAEVPESTKEALSQLKAKGHFIAIATGRIQADAWDIAQSLGITSAVSDGGECVTLDGVIQYHNGLDRDACADMLDKLDSQAHPWAVATHNQKIAYTKDDTYLKKVPLRYYKVEIAPDLDVRKEGTVHKIFISTDHVDDLNLCGLPHVWLRKGTLLVEPTAKEKGIQYIMQKYSLTNDQIVVFGDGMNDRSMFRPEWMSVAMGNAKDELKAKARYVTTRADEDGIYNACKHFGWID